MKYVILFIIIGFFASCQLDEPDYPKPTPEDSRGELWFLGCDGYFSISPDESKLIYMQEGEYYLYNFNSSSTSEISENIESIKHIDWYNETIYYTNDDTVPDDHIVRNLFVMDYNTKVNTLLVDSILSYSVLISNTQVAYSKYTDIELPNPELWICDMITGNEKRVGFGFPISFSSVDQEIVFSYNEQYDYKLKVLKLTNGLEKDIPSNLTASTFLWKENILKAYYYDRLDNQYKITDVWDDSEEKFGDFYGEPSKSGKYLLRVYSTAYDDWTEKITFSVYDFFNDRWYKNLAYGYDKNDFNLGAYKFSYDEKSIFYQCNSNIYKVTF